MNNKLSGVIEFILWLAVGVIALSFLMDPSTHTLGQMSAILWGFMAGDKVERWLSELRRKW